ncbi:MAG: hypothetical protein Fur0023_01040 [Bacteroidia bacterium]
MKYQFKIRFNTQHQTTNHLYWRVIINEEEHLFSNVIIRNKEVKTIKHTLPSGEEKWSIYCESDTYQVDKNNTIIIE